VNWEVIENMEDDKIIKLDDKEYVLRKFGIAEKIAIKDSCVDALGNVKIGTMQLKMLASSLVSWNYTDNNGNMIPPSEKNILKYMNPDHFDRLSEEAISLNELNYAEKKTSLDRPASNLDGLNENTENKKVEGLNK